MTHARPPFTLTGFDHVVLLIDDMERALRFYYDVLGCVPGYRYPALGMEQVWCGNCLIVLWDITTEGGAEAGKQATGGRNMDHLCIATTPFEPEALRAHLAAHGVEIEREATHGGGRGIGYSCYFRDPFGNLIELKGPAEYPDGTA